jgi:hypothetical protein
MLSALSVIPAERAKRARAGIHNRNPLHDGTIASIQRPLELWIPGSPLRGAPE